jgi:hypothetical protein
VFYMEGSDFGNQFYAWKDRQAAPGVWIVVSNPEQSAFYWETSCMRLCQLH